MWTARTQCASGSTTTHATPRRAAAERKHTGDVTAAAAGQGATWFTAPVGECLDAGAAAGYARGFLAGGVEYLCACR
ncbi:hypothetical protein [Rhodococcus ruber]